MKGSCQRKHRYQVKAFEFYPVVERLANFSVKRQIVGILGIAGHLMVSIKYSSLFFAFLQPFQSVKTILSSQVGQKQAKV